MALSKEKSKRQFDFQRERFLLWGAPKIAKTTLIAAISAALKDSVYFVATEDGQRKVEVFKSDVRTWDEFESTIADVKADPQFKMICVDTVDALWQIYMTGFLKKHNVKHEGDIPFQGHDMIRRGFVSVFYELQAVNKGFMFLAHDRVAEDGEGVKGPRRCTPNLPYDKHHVVRDTIEGMCDFIWYITKGVSTVSGKVVSGRVIHTAASLDYIAGSRFPVIDPIPLVDDDPEQSAIRVLNAYKAAADSAVKKTEGSK